MSKKSVRDENQLEFDYTFWVLRKEVNFWFGNMAEVLAGNQDRDLATVILNTGKFLVWNSSVIDRPAAFAAAARPLPKLQSVEEIGLTLRDAGIAALEGKNVTMCNRRYAVGMEAIHARLDGMEKILRGGAK